MGSGFAKKKKEAREMQEKFMKMQETLKSQNIEGSSGSGLVKVTLNGEGELLNISLKPECVDPEDVEGLEDLIKAAFNDAKKKMNSAAMNMPGMPGISGFPGFGF